jgi:hypothetical protein
MLPYSNPTRRNMEDDLNIFIMEDDLNFSLNTDDLNFFLMEDDPKQNYATKND